MIIEIIKSDLLISLSKVAKGIEIADIILNSPQHKAHGDFSTPIALELAKQLKKSPIEIANNIVANLSTIKYVLKIEVIKPGFINFFVDYDQLSKDLLTKISLNELSDLSKYKDIKILIEHTSVNPNKALHVGHLRNALLGDTIARLMKRLGFSVEVQNYIDDTGSQVADTTLGFLYIDNKIPENMLFDDFCWELYTKVHRMYKEDESLLEKRKIVTKKIEERDNEIADQADILVEKIVQHHLDLLSEFGIYYDLLVYESDVLASGLWDNAFGLLKKSSNFVFKEEGDHSGCWVLEYAGSGGDKIFVRSNGTKVYTAKDTAYHMWKFGLLNTDFNYEKWKKDIKGKEVWRTNTKGSKLNKFGKGDKVINIIDERQSYPQEMVKLAFKSVGYEKYAKELNHIGYGVVELSPKTAKELNIDISDGRKSYAMSGRNGIGVKVRDLISFLMEVIQKQQPETKKLDKDTAYKITISSIRYYMLKFRPKSKIIFDFEDALNINGNTGPYLQYSYARANKLLVKAGEFVETYSKSDYSESEQKLLMMIYKWTMVLDEARENLSTAGITDYIYELSASFHSFYQNNQIMNSETDVKNFRLTLVKAYMKIAVDVFDILGILPIDKM